MYVGDHLPLQQGLRQLHLLSQANVVGDHLPLQQGLRPVFISLTPNSSRRPSSITTRIKTLCETSRSYLCCVRDHLPLQQGLRQ